MEELINSLKVLMSDVVTFYFKAHGYHWNVEGDDFPQYHAFFEEIYEDVYGSIDPIAENIRKCGDYAPFRLERFIEYRTVSDTNVTPEEVDMSTDLYNANNQVLASLYGTFAAASAQNRQGIMNFLADRIDQHEKWMWQLGVIIKPEQNEVGD
jgi:starvation-inducible DNA-binding protein